jgi:hypothetical protein
MKTHTPYWDLVKYTLTSLRNIDLRKFCSVLRIRVNLYHKIVPQLRKENIKFKAA